MPSQNIQYYDGVMDDILIYDRALSLTEVSSLFENGSDTDNDGVLDANDQCVATPNGEVTDVNGCGISQLCPCDNDWKNHGAYTRCVAQTAEDFVADGLITEAEKDATVSTAAQSSCGSKK